VSVGQRRRRCSRRWGSARECRAARTAQSRARPQPLPDPHAHHRV